MLTRDKDIAKLKQEVADLSAALAAAQTGVSAVIHSAYDNGKKYGEAKGFAAGIEAVGKMYPHLGTSIRALRPPAAPVESEDKMESELIATDERAPKNPAPWPDPTPEMLTSPAFEAVWQRIKSWDINVPEVYGGYCGATGNHVRAILDALSASAPAGAQPVILTGPYPYGPPLRKD